MHNVHTLFCPLRCPIPPTRAPGWAREFTNSRLDGIDDEGCWLSLSMFSSGMLMAVERFLKCCTCSTGTQGNSAMNKRKILLPARLRLHADSRLGSGAYTQGQLNIDTAQRVNRRVRQLPKNPDALYERVCVGVVFPGFSSRAIRSGSPPSGASQVRRHAARP